MKLWINCFSAVPSVRASVLEHITCASVWLVYIMACLWLLYLTGCATDPDDKRFFYDSWRLKRADPAASSQPGDLNRP